jgi:hypothetical protein
MVEGKKREEKRQARAEESVALYQLQLHSESLNNWEAWS